jgi:SecD/SecF fusion protein
MPKKETTLLDKIIAQGGGPVLDFSPKDTATVNGYFKRADIKILLTAEQRYAKFVWENQRS